jgi:hypothetical protein
VWVSLTGPLGVKEFLAQAFAGTAKIAESKKGRAGFIEPKLALAVTNLPEGPA